MKINFNFETLETLISISTWQSFNLDISFHECQLKLIREPGTRRETD